MAISQWQPAVVRLPNITASGIAHGYVRWPDGRPATPFGCRWCGTLRSHHGRSYMRGRGMHGWEQPTQAQIKARMLARRAARKAICRCPDPAVEFPIPQPMAPVVDPWKCEAAHCRMHDFLVGGWLTPLSSGAANARLTGGAR